MTKSIATSPYYDDFDEFKNFHQILFKPGFPVQARELTQIQSILQNQISKMGNHIFQQGSIVIPGNSRGDLGVSYVQLEDTYNFVAIDHTLFEGKVIVGATSGVKAVVKKALAKTTTDPISLYVSYTTGGVVGGVANGKLTFDLGEDIYIESQPTVLATVKPYEGSIGTGSMAYVNQGVYYVNGTFVSVNSQSTVISKYDSTPTVRVLLQIVESFVDYTQDSTLLDPAQGSYNFASPGADRYKLDLVLTTLPYDATVSDNYVEIMRYNGGVLEEHVQFPKYNELEKNLARRTYDEAGDYVVNGLAGTIVEAKRIGANGGLSPTGSADNFAVTVTPGKAYISGFEIEKIAPTSLIAAKARTVDHIKLKQMNIRPEFGRYILVSHITNGFSLATRELVSLTTGATGGSTIGSARILAIDYHIGDPASNNAIYKVWLSEVAFTSTNYSMTAVGGITFSGGTAYVNHALTATLSAGTYAMGDVVNTSGSVRTATVQYWDSPTSTLYVYKNNASKDTPFVGDAITDATTSATSVVTAKTAYFGSAPNTSVFQLPLTAIKSLKNASNVYDIAYSTQHQVTITTNSSGVGAVTIASGSFVTPEAGTFSAFTSTGAVNPSLFSLSGSNNTLNITGGPTSATIICYATVIKTGLAPKTKTLTNYTETIVVGSPTAKVSLAKVDVYRINSITVAGNVVTPLYLLNDGQTDHAYYRASVSLNSGASIPASTLVINYDYFEHTSGDYFSVDSYAGNGVGYLDYILNYRSASGTVYNLLTCIDCRPTVGTSGTDFGTGAIVGDMLVNRELLSSSIQYFVPRQDVLIINKDGKLKLVTGTPDESPRVPSIPTDTVAIETYFIPAYTNNINNINQVRNLVDRFTMSGIAKIEDRLFRLEQFSTLSATESSVVNYNILDAATGLNRFKTGYLVESFDQPFTLSDFTNSQFHVSFDDSAMTSAIERMECPVTVIPGSSSHFVEVNGVYMLPYTETVFASQPLSSRVTNINPFLMISWGGRATVAPNIDNWVDIIDKPTIFNNVRKDTVYLTNWIPAPTLAPAIPATNIPASSPSNSGGLIGTAVNVVGSVVSAATNVVSSVVGAAAHVVSSVVGAVTRCCVVATALSETGEWSKRDVYRLTKWATEELDTKFFGRALHRGYHIIGPNILIPMLSAGGWRGKYIKWAFTQGTGMLRGKKTSFVAKVNSISWFIAMIAIGLVTSEKKADANWKKLYSKD